MTNHPLPYPAGNMDSVQAYLFECDGESLFAISRDHSGMNLPSRACPVGWQLRQTFVLGEAMPRAIDPEPVLRGLRFTGYYIWREG